MGSNELAAPIKKSRGPDVEVKVKWVNIQKNLNLHSKAIMQMTLTPQTTLGKAVLECSVLSSIVSWMPKSSTLAANYKLRTIHITMLRDWCLRQQVGLWSSQTLKFNPSGKQNLIRIVNLNNKSQTRTSKLFNSNKLFQVLKVLKMYHK